MPFQKLSFKPGIVRDMTTLANEGGWYAGDKIRFRQGFPEKIGGWARTSANVFQGLARSLNAWVTLAGVVLYGVGTHLKMYVAMGGQYFDVTPIRQSFTVSTNAFTTTNGSAVVKCNVTAHGAANGDFVVLTGAATAVGGIPALTLQGEFQVTVVDANTVSIIVSAAATSTATGGNSVFDFQLPIGQSTATTSYAWGSGTWGSGAWGQSAGSVPMRIWSQVNYGELMIFGQNGGPMYQFTPTVLAYGFNRGVPVSSLSGASSVPLFQNMMMFSPAARILVLFGTNSYLGTTLDPLMVRWADSDSVVQWAPAATNLAGEYRLSRGSKIVAVAAVRQDILILTDTAVYVQQFIGAPYVFGFTQQADNISVASQNAIATAGGVAFWMGGDKFYTYDGSVRPLDCPLKNEVFNNMQLDQITQVFAGTNEGFDEVWWFYPSTGSAVPDKYIIYNYVQKIWYYGSMTRTAWLDTALASGPIAATAFSNLVLHENGIDDQSTATTTAVNAYVQSADFDIGDGQSYAFVRKLLPDINYAGSTAATPTVYVSVMGRDDPGGAYGQTPAMPVSLQAALPVPQYTPEVCVRIRARSMNLTIQSSDVGVKWQLGAPRIEVRPSGRSV